ncbi:hypothetical protein ACFQ49_04180 [Kroppenstedtia eburnea]|uniref:Uncharacterized protein n=1 Tax=Kroppenstedtia eburnea TaxID=714067 RepID=A0A1N7J3G2_9BACL|nr:hypothetical protein [Kroppenstedtia eburnea]QKI82472.1 hypothetical protein GXN75_10940 [Kroppenstedtia eburnea]SIS43898.1 hypothetical protein SAMN05421790_101679 [Kroppenstedtia eburnea]
MKKNQRKYRPVPARRRTSVPVVKTAAGTRIPVQTQVALGKGKPNPKTEEVLFFCPPFFFPPPFAFFGPFGAGFFI